MQNRSGMASLNSKKNFFSAAVAALVATQTQAVEYNGTIQYFIADLGPTSPCHHLYEQSYTWVDLYDVELLDRTLNSIVDAGFNGLRFPMWPNDDRVTGQDPEDFTKPVDKYFCDLMVKNVIKRIKTAPEDSKYKDLYIYLSPGLENRTYQEALTY